MRALDPYESDVGRLRSDEELPQRVRPSAWLEKTMPDREVEVLVQLAGEDVPAGRLWAHRRQNVESATFVYAAEYLARKGSYPLDPAPACLGPASNSREPEHLRGIL